MSAAHSPPSSPPPSPSFPLTDSSPPSSPSQEPFVISEAPSTADQGVTPTHPFAASNNATRNPPKYERGYKRTSSKSPVDFEDLLRLKRAKTFMEEVHQDESRIGQESTIDFLPPDEPPFWEQTLWEEAIANVVDTGYGTVDLR